MRVATQAGKVAVKLSAALMLLVPSATLQARGQPEDATNVGAQACADCHQDLSAEFTRTVHARLASFELSGNVAGCEACHGPGSKHIESLDTADIIGFSDEASHESIEGRCLSCHTSGMGAYWPYSEHSESGITCTNCHKIHQTGPNLPPDPHGPALIERATVTGMAKNPALVKASLKKIYRLSVKSDPEGARVYLDGKLKGRPPLELKVIGKDPRDLRILKEGYSPISKEVVSSEGQELEFPLENMKTVSRIYSEVKSVNIYNKEDWEKVRLFLFQHMTLYEDFFLEYRDIIRYS